MKGKLKDKILDILDSIRAFFAKILESRISIVVAVLFILFTIIGVRLFYLQIIKSEYYTDNFTQKAQKTITTEAARGKIYDRNGFLLAYNEISYSVTIVDEIPNSDTRGDTLNGIIYRAINLIEKYGDSIIDDFNIELDNKGKYVFKQHPVTRQTTFLINIYGGTTDELAEKGINKYSAEQIMDELTERYGVSSAYTKQEKLKIITVRYALSLTAYQKYVSTIIAKNISQMTMSAILESTDDLTGVDVVESYKRVYNDAQYFSHVLGYTGEISEEELAELNLENPAGITYSVGDQVGKSGIEQTFDSYLQGEKGTKTVFVDNTGNILEVLNETKSAKGNDVYLTIDHDLTLAAYNILEKKLAACLINKIKDYDIEKSEKQTYVYIPIKDVYVQLLTNVMDFTEFSRADASEREVKTQKKFEEKKAKALEWLSGELFNTYAKPQNELSPENNAYMYFIYDVLGSLGILDKSLIDQKDEIYLEWVDETVSLREFLQHAIAENWINVSQIESAVKYSKSDEIYEAIISNALNELNDNRDFAEKIYYYMVYDKDLEPYDICLMLYDQKKIPEDDYHAQLQKKSISTYDFVIKEIENLVLTPAMLALDPCSGSLSVTDADTGQILALVSYPMFDNNKLSGTVDSQYWYELNINDSQPLFNYATTALTAPGSTFKLCTSVAGLAAGFITPETVISDQGRFTEIVPSPKCYVYPGTHGNENLVGAIRDSCNYFYFQIGYNMGLDQYGEYNSSQALDIIADYAVQLGLGTKSGVEINEKEPRVSTTDSVRTAIGQGTNGYAVVHMNRYVNTIANSGNNYQLTLIKQVVARDGRIVIDNKPVLTNVVELDQTQWDTIHEGMHQVCLAGTASSFFTHLGTSIAGKTGTAEENVYRSNHTAFVGYAPFENPEVSFACMIRNSDSTSYPGGVLSEVMQFYFGQLTLEDVFEKPVENSISGFHSE